MSNDKVKVVVTKQAAAPSVSASKVRPAYTPPLFRKVDWLTLLITFAAVWVGYYLTLAPELTLEDSGELAVGSFYAGIPHPPGYPVWTIYTWLWTVLLPFKNIAWRVALAEATGGALAAGLLGMLVSRGSSLLIEGIEELKAIPARWVTAICVVSGFVSGTLIGFNGFMWSQSVIVEVYSFSVASLMITMLCLLRWIYAPYQRRFLYYAMFAFGICFTNHQTLIVAAMGIEVAIAAADFRMGRYLFLGNSIIFLSGMLLKAQHMLRALEENQAVYTIFIVVGVLSIAAYLWFTVLSKETFLEFCLDGCMAAFFVLLAATPGDSGLGILGLLGAVAALAGVVKFARDTGKLGWEWLVVIVCGICWIAGAGFYFYMPLAGMTNPPMQWGYPRTVDGFIHAFTRGQYEKTNPTDIIGDPLRFLTQLKMLAVGIVEEFNWLYAFLALVPFVFFRRLHRRERAWLVGIAAIYLCLGVLLLILLNPPPDRAAQELVRVFFTASHTMIALLMGYGLTVVAAYMATHYQRFRSWGFIGGMIAVALAIVSFTQLTTDTFFGQGANVSLSQLLSFVGSTFTNKDQFGLPVYAGLVLIAMTLIFLAALAVYKNRAPLAITLGVFALMPVHPILTHWADNEQRNHWFGYWFGHDMFAPPLLKDGKLTYKEGKPLYPPMAKNAVLYGGTDPGRFCPTYMIFDDSFTEPKNLPEFDRSFDRRDVYIITQNALADGTYLNYIRAHYNRSEQQDPPFFSELLRSEPERRENQFTNKLALAALPVTRPLDELFTGLGDRIEKQRRTFTSWFSEDHFTDLPGFLARISPAPNQDPVAKFVYDSLSRDTKQLISSKGNEKAIRSALAKDLNRLLDRELATRKAIEEKAARRAELVEDIQAGSTSKSKAEQVKQLDAELAELSRVQPLYTPERFKGVKISEYLQDFIKQNPQSHSRVRLNRLLLESAFPKEIVKTKGGVYPDREIHIATPKESEKCFNDYLMDAQRRLQLNQLKPGEDVRVVEGKVQVSGQIAVMAINGLLTKVMFDANPKNEFYVEESFPLDWMYDYLTPYGIIMKVNRQPVPEMTEEIVRNDHEFWTAYSDRLIGNWITYDTPVKDIAAFAERVYLRRNFKGFTGDHKFVRDDQAQKAFSKLRSSIGGVYNWRIGHAKTGSAEQQRMIREADFAFKQAFAFCPYSPEAVFRYVTLLASPYMSRYDDALSVAETCLKLDPNNGQVEKLVEQLREIKNSRAGMSPAQAAAPQIEEVMKAAEDTNNFQAQFNLASTYMQSQHTTKALEVLDGILANPNAEGNALRALITAYSSLGQMPKVTNVIGKLQARVSANSNDFDSAVALSEGYRTIQQNEPAAQVLDKLLATPGVTAPIVLQVAQEYASMMNYPKLEPTLEKLVQLSPDSPEAWYDLAAMRITMGKSPQAVQALSNSLMLSAARLKRDPKAKDLVPEVEKDSRFTVLKDNPEFQRLVSRK